MNTFLLLWNPTQYPWNELEDNVRQVKETGRLELKWSCGRTNKIQTGDRVFLLRLCVEPRGIMGSGIVVEEPSLGEHFTDSTKEVLYVKFKVDVLLNPNNQAILTLEQLNQGTLADQHWTPQGSGISVKPELVEELETVWRDFTASSK